MKKKTLSLFFLSLLFVIAFYRIYDLNFLQHETYEALYKQKTEIFIEGESAPRGRILDTNGIVLVDNVVVKRIAYRKINQPSFLEEVEIADQLLNFFDIDEASEKNLREYYVLRYKEEAELLITDEERRLVSERKLTTDDLASYKKERITKETLDSLSSREKKIAELYMLMNSGYSYQNKILYDEADEKLVAQIVEKNIPGVFVDTGWKRIYPYGDLMRSVFGSLNNGIPEEDKEYYLNLGYKLNDIVGISYLEKQYEEYLKGKKAVYRVTYNKALVEVSEAERGNDIYLSIDIVLQQKLDALLKETLFRVKKLQNTEYLKESYALVGDPNTGAIKAISGVRLLSNGSSYDFQDITVNAILSSYTVGSIVKGASHTVGYLNGVIDVDKKIRDSCVKLYLVPEKCSYKSLGYLDDISALKWSSNYYQFLTAIKLSGKNYSYNMQLNAPTNVFEKYRNVFSNYGLGSKTGIDLPNEQIGIIGNIESDDLLLNLTIGQYDNYTPVQLLQYINTIHTNGVRHSLSLMKEIRSNSGEVILTNEVEVLSKIELDVFYYDRIKEGFRGVLYNGTGSGYVPRSINAYGKTGTSESFYDSNSDGLVDTKTISSTFAMIGPSSNSEYSLVIVTPNLSHYDGVKDYTAPFNRYISTAISEYLLEY